jgi:hypothetical protein
LNLTAPVAKMIPCGIEILGPRPRCPEEPVVVERRIELNRKYRRKAKLKKLKSRLATAKDTHEKEKLLVKMKKAHPPWVPFNPAAG